jgi:hypothetical protein
MDWDGFFTTSDAAFATSQFTDHIMECLNVIAPPLPSTNSLNHPKAHSSKFNSKIRRLKSKYRTSYDFSAIIQMANLKHGYLQSYELRKLKEEKTALNSKLKAAALSQLLKRRNPTNGQQVSYITHADGSTTEDPQAVCESFNTYFASVYNASSQCPIPVGPAQLPHPTLSNIPLSTRD